MLERRVVRNDVLRILKGRRPADGLHTYVVEQSNKGERVYDIYSRLLKDRIIFLNGEIDMQTSDLIQMLFLQAEDPEKEISLYINSPGGSVYAGWRYTTRCSS